VYQEHLTNAKNTIKQLKSQIIAINNKSSDKDFENVPRTNFTTPACSRKSTTSKKRMIRSQKSLAKNIELSLKRGVRE